MGSVNNLRRKISELPALTEEDFIAETTSQDPAQHRRKHSDEHSALLHYTATSRPESSSLNTTRQTSRTHSERTPSPQTSWSPPEDEPEEEHEQEQETEPYSPTQCLFCTHQSSSLATNLTHMATTHGLFIPHATHVDLSALFAHLASTIFTHRECLYCALQKPSVQSIQTHMRDKGHCMLRLDPDSELHEFWDASGSEKEDGDEDAEGVVKVSDTELRLPSGAIINSRSHASTARHHRGPANQRAKAASDTLKTDAVAAITASDAPSTSDSKSPRSDRRVAVRGEMGLIGVSDEQRRALVATEKKMRRREAVAKAKGRHAMEMQPVKTIYYKTENPVYQAG